MKRFGTARHHLANAVVVAVALASVVMASGCGNTGTSAAVSTGDEITIGTDVPLTGDVAGQAADLLAGYKLGVAEVNASGGINGKKLVLKVKDDKFDPSVAANAVKQLVGQDHVVALLGTFGSPGGLTTSAVAEQYKVPIVHTFVSDPQITSQGYKYTFNLFPLAAQEEAATDALIAAIPELRTVAIVHINLGWAEAGASASVQTLQASGRKVVAKISVPTGESNYTAALAKVRAADPDVVKLIGYDGDDATMVKQIRQLGIKPKMLYTEGDLVNEPMSALGRARAGLTGVPSWFPGATAFPKANAVAASYKSRTGRDANTQVLKGYQAVEVLAEALKGARSLSGDDIRDALSQLQMDTVLGHVKFGGNGQADAPVMVAQFQKGMELKTIWPERLADSQLHILR